MWVSCLGPQPPCHFLLIIIVCWMVVASAGSPGVGVQDLRRAAAHGGDMGGAVHLHALGKVLAPMTGDDEGSGNLLLPGEAGREPRVASICQMHLQHRPSVSLFILDKKVTGFCKTINTVHNDNVKRTVIHNLKS